MKKNIFQIGGLFFFLLIFLNSCSTIGMGKVESHSQDDLGSSSSRGWTLFLPYEGAESRARANRTNAEADYTRALASRLENNNYSSNQSKDNQAIYRFVAQNVTGKFASVYHPGYHRYIPLNPGTRSHTLIELSYIPDRIYFKNAKGRIKSLKPPLKKMEYKKQDPIYGPVDLIITFKRQ